MPTHQNVQPLEDDNDDHDDEITEPIPLGEPFALAVGVDLLDAEGKIPGCVICCRCECGSAFRFSATAPGYKACPGCGTQYTHALVVAPHDDLEIVDQLIEVIETEPGDEGEPDDQLEGIEPDDEDPEPEQATAESGSNPWDTSNDDPET